MSAGVRLLTGMIVVLLAAYWASVGLDKIAREILDTNTTAQPLWTDQFPTWLIVGICACEVITAIVMVLGRPGTGLVLGLAMLAVFSAALLLVPIKPNQPCGCGGPIETAIDPFLRNAFLASVHVLALVLVRSNKQHVHPTLAT